MIILSPMDMYNELLVIFSRKYTYSQPIPTSVVRVWPSINTVFYNIGETVNMFGLKIYNTMHILYYNNYNKLLVNLLRWTCNLYSTA